MRWLIVTVSLLFHLSGAALGQELFTDPPGNVRKRAEVASNIKNASADERRALVMAVRASVPKHSAVYKDETEATEYHQTCKSAVDTWRVYFGRANPSREIDREMAELLNALNTVRAYASMFRLLREQFKQLEAMAALEGRRLGPSDTLRHMEMERGLDREARAYFDRVLAFVDGLTEIFQSMR